MHNPERAGRERVLRAAVLAGDTGAWRVLYDEAFDGLSRYVRWRTGTMRDVAEEIVQETWLIAVRRIKGFDPEQGSFLGWLRAIAANLLLNNLKKRTRRNERPVQGLSGQPLDYSENADKQRLEQAYCIAESLASLPAHYEAVLRAKYLDEMSVAEIALERNETPKAVESLLTRARQAFREAYQRLEGTYEHTP
jgi:RNA polymerase sigma-70 factor (ECF subfamily)